MDIKDLLSKDLGINKFTGHSLKEAITRRYDLLPDPEKRRISREIALHVIKASRPARARKAEDTPQLPSLRTAAVLGVNYASLLDVTVEWETGPDGTLRPLGYRLDAGGDQINVAKVFDHFNENIALVALTGKEGAEVTSALERGFLSKNIIPSLIRATDEDTQVAVYNVVDGDTLHGMFGWADELREEVIRTVEQETMAALGLMLEGGRDNVWMVLSAGGIVRHNSRLAYYASLVKRVKEKYHDRVKLLIDFKFLAGPEEALSVLNIPRKTPQDMIKPNLEEFIQLLVSSGLAGADVPDKDAMTDELVKTYAIKLRDKYNLLGVLVSMDKAGVMLVIRDRIIREKGIRIVSACPTGSGDSLKAGVLYALSNGKSFEEAVHTGNLFGAATASMEGTQTVTPETLARTEALARAQNVAPIVERLPAHI